MEIRNHTKINPHTAGEVERGARSADNSRSGSASKTGGPRPHGDQVTLTDAAQRLLQHSETETGAPLDKSKVAAIRKAIADGRYTVDTAKVASRLVDLHNPEKP